MKTYHVVAAVIVRDDAIFATQRGYGDYKDWWEFPGGKIEAGESPQEALVREIAEELDASIKVGEMFVRVEYDYPEFHLDMQCFWCTLAPDSGMKLLEHEDARWLTRDELDSVQWLPADVEVIEAVRASGRP